MASAIILVLNHPYITYTINVVTNQLLSVQTIAELLLLKTGSAKQISWMGKGSIWKGDEPILQASNRLIKNLDFKFTYPTSYDAMYGAIQEIIC